MSLLRKAITGACCLLTPAGLAQYGDETQPMHIVADATAFNYRTGIGIYEGNVIVTQGKTRLDTDRLETHNNAQHKIQETIAYGEKKPARYVTRLKPDDPSPLEAKADLIRFYPFRSLVILEGNAEVKHGEDIFQGPVAIYDMKRQTVSAPPSSSGRTRILVQPDRVPT